MTELPFKIHSSLKNIIGRDLITDDLIAVFELVKNAYDAHAKNVKIIFERDKLVIWDDGKGMSYNDIINKWLYVAYSAKREGIEDDEFENELKDYRDKIGKKAYFAGAKGIGRFSCDKLGRYLRMITKKMGSQNSAYNELLIDWKKFDEESTDEFINVKTQYSQLDKINYPNFPHGTLLEISGLNNKWNRKKKLELKHSLEKLINPVESLSNETTFSIEIEDETESDEDKKEKTERDKVNGIIKNFIFETLKIKTTQLLTEINKDKIITTLHDRGELIFKISEPNEYDKLLNTRFHLFFLNQAAKTNFTKQMGLKPVRFGSLFLYKNGIRVYPYGDPGKDFLGVDRRKQQGYKRFLGTRELIGRTEVIDSKDEFRETSSRDGGLIETTGFFQLKDAFYEKALKRIEKYVVNVQWPFKQDQFSDNVSELNNIEAKEKILSVISKLVDNEIIELIDYNKEFLNIVNEKIEKASPKAFKDLLNIANKSGDSKFQNEIKKTEKEYQKLIKEKEKAQKKAEEAEEAKRKAEEQRVNEEKQRRKAEIEAKEKELKRREEEVKRKEAEQKALRAEEDKKKKEKEVKLEKNKNIYLLSTRHTSDEVQDLLHSINITTDQIEGNLDNLFNDQWINKNESVLYNLKQIKFHFEKIKKMANLVTKADINNLKAKIALDIPKFIKEYFKTESNYLYDDIEVSIDSSADTFKSIISILDLSLIFDNLMSNAKKAKAKKVNIVISTPSKKLLQVDFSDNGEGLDPDLKDTPEQIFELGITTRSGGSGIGLYTIREKMRKEMHGDISYIGDGNYLKGATFRLIFK